MKFRIFPFLALILIISMSLTFAGCNPHTDPGPGPDITDLQVSPKVVDVGSVVNISAIVTNPNYYNSSCNVTCFVDGSLIGSKIVKVAAKANQTVTFNYTPTKEGTFNVTIPTPRLPLSTSFGAVNPPGGCWNGTCVDGGYWVTKYDVVDGRITLNYTIGHGFCLRKELTIQRGDGVVILLVNKAVINGTREVTLPSAGWQFDPIFVSDMFPGLNMSLVISLKENAAGKLYVQNRIGDVDVSSVSSLNSSPMQVNTYGDGKKDAAGSLLVDAVLEGNAQTSAGESLVLPLGLVFTTGNSTNVISMPTWKKIDGATLVSNGMFFAEEGGVASYVGTNGTITATGTGDCLGLIFKTMHIDLQIEIKLVLEPESIE
jgi:hypothetical protein